jgi:hypothetical protein
VGNLSARLEYRTDMTVAIGQRRHVRFLTVALSSAAVLAACTMGGTTGESLPTAFPASVLSAAPLQLCRGSHCMATYTVTISNPTDGDANVQDCAVSPPVPGLDRLPIMGIAGLSVPAGSTRKTTARFPLPISAKRVEALVGRTLECTGIDWHGHAPI